MKRTVLGFMLVLAALGVRRREDEVSGRLPGSSASRLQSVGGPVRRHLWHLSGHVLHLQSL